ncbi:type II toxin-antitoxin system RelE/ParE family toxin [Dyadobacter sp. CY326]|uniref:type II toxin-antitoxin system RelE/ParE family toxin n=1 Tax=Dyadobacter sp. CY326 TaxID=2907300 RepID=UPI001F2B0DAB|nr:type II toxin-antitoxin system RelE/ParE family toxin [Dyadobacter sp. CY326]MCE7065522.1 type II toxin-antitoxin system RelE/ParE family toxin [Dyadobacter sp. CY326]
MEQIRELVFYKNYFDDFYKQQNPKVRDKIDHIIYLIMHFDRIPEKFLKHIEGQKGLYELRIEAGSNIFRVFCCFDKGRIVVLFNGFQKKSQKTPPDEIQLAVKLMKEYFERKST